MNDTIKVVFVTDENYSKQMLVAIQSIINNSNKLREIDFYILDLGISERNIKLIKDRYMNLNNIKINFIQFDSTSLSKYKIKTHVSSAAYAKIYIPNLIPVDKIIYLDCDLIFNNDISNLWKEFEKATSIKAVWNPFYNYDNKYLGVDQNHRTFNSGVMLLNLELMREKDSVNKLEDFLNKYHDKTRLHDQAAFNAIFKSEWKELDINWNCQVSMLQNYHSRLNISKMKYFNMHKNPNIIHYTSNSKPWQFRNSHPYKELYKKIHMDIFGSVEYSDVNLKSALQKARESIRYKYYYLLNLK